MRVMLPDGTVRNISRTGDSRLFNLVVGGYGLFGVILDVELEIVPNAVYESGREVLDYRQFVPMLASRIVPDPGIGLMYAHLSTAPQSLLRETIVYTYKEVRSTTGWQSFSTSTSRPIAPAATRWTRSPGR